MGPLFINYFNQSLKILFFRSEDYSEDVGYTVITEESTISALMNESGVAERWHQEPKKQLVMVCRLDCDKGYSAAGREMFKYTYMELYDPSGLSPKKKTCLENIRTFQSYFNMIKVKKPVVFSRQINGMVTLMDIVRKIQSQKSVKFQLKLRMETGIVLMICFMTIEVKVKSFLKMNSFKWAKA